MHICRPGHSAVLPNNILGLLISFLLLLWFLLLEAGRGQWHTQPIVCWIRHLYDVANYPQIFVGLTDLSQLGLSDVGREIYQQLAQSGVRLHMVQERVCELL